MRQKRKQRIKKKALGNTSPNANLALPWGKHFPTGTEFQIVLLISLALIAFNLAIYSQVRHFEFIGWDDPLYVSRNAEIAKGLTWPGVLWAFTTGHAANWHPLTWISHMLDVELFGVTAGPHHLVNVLFHIAN
jgi:hypothetical protein